MVCCKVTLLSFNIGIDVCDHLEINLDCGDGDSEPCVVNELEDTFVLQGSFDVTTDPLNTNYISPAGKII